ncbi:MULTISPECIES: hypothetical protein [Kitasatospora]|uniref:Uncharacterized protein n=1 Tax=Kitasatospora cystarginea TaxID=58350 RepID=A0ABP5Q9S6_9ACTN
MTAAAPAPVSPAVATATRPTGRLSVLAGIAAPALFGVYGVIRLLPGSRQPGPGWTVGHLCLLGALLTFGVVFRDLYRVLAERGRVAAVLGYGTAMVGTATGVGQVLIDLYSGFRADTLAEQNRFFAEVQSYPGVLPIFYQVLPVFFHLGLLAMVIVLAVRRRLPFWSPLAILAGVVAMAASMDMMTVGVAFYALALLPLYRQASRQA